MRIGICIQWGVEGWTGGINYLRHLVLGAASLPQPLRPRIVLLFEAAQVPALHRYESIMPLADEVRVMHGVRDAAGVYHVHDAETAFAGLDMAYPLPHGLTDVPSWLPRVFWIPDFQHRHLPRFFPERELADRDALFEGIVSGADLVVLSSEAARRDLMAFYGAAPERTFVLPFCTVGEEDWYSGDVAAVQARYGLTPGYLICCNQFWAHKDHLTLFRALARLRREGLVLPLVCTGGTDDYRDPAYFPMLQRALESLGIAGQVRILGLIDRRDQIQLLRGADAVLQPSLFEGWSTVVEDARALGKSIVHSDIGVHMEQDPPHGHAFRAGDADDLARVLRQALPDFGPTAGAERETTARDSCHGRLLHFGMGLVHLARAAQEARQRACGPSQA